MGHAPPVTKLALAFGAGAGWVQAGAPVVFAPLAALAILAWPNPTSGRPVRRELWVLVAAVGLCSAALGDGAGACFPPPGAEPVGVDGTFLAAPRAGAAPFLPVSGCGPLTVVTSDSAAPAGQPVRIVGSWREGRYGPWFLGRRIEPLERDAHGPRWRWLTVRWRDGLVARLGRLYGEQAPLVSALSLARREGFDPELRDGFARIGIAHLLAISGFHVGVIAGFVLALLRALGRPPRQAALGAAGAAWAYVGFIGFPDAACRAALILALVAVSRARVRPPARWGALGAALIVLLALDPGRLSTPGFQLSFAGAAGLVAWSGAISKAIRRLTGRRCPEGLASGVAAGVAATLATLPIVAWHFERVSLVGIPVTLGATPLVVLVLVGSLASLTLDFISPAAASLLAGGVSAVVWVLEAGASLVASWPWVSAWMTRTTVLGATAGMVAASALARHPRVRARARRVMTGLYVLVGVISWPLILTWQARGTAEILMIDVGQGDAIAVRSPRGHWILVDAGPEAPGSDPRAHAVVRALRARGVRRLEALVLTHPDLDHIGGAGAVLSSFDVGAVYDPGQPAGKRPFVEVLDVAASRSVPWRAARAGDRLDLDELRIDVLHPAPGIRAEESNATSVVLRVAYGDFDALLTGDAFKDVERSLLPDLKGDVELLKVGHHGSDTSTDSLLLARARPEIALISVGRSNRYGHPSAVVLRRLQRSGARVHRTDREGTISVVARPDGSFSLMGGR